MNNEIAQIIANENRKRKTLKQLVDAIKTGNLKNVKSICKANQGIIKDIINKKYIGKTPLEYAQDNSKLFNYLIKQGADPIVAVQDQLLRAIETKDPKKVELVCQNNKDQIGKIINLYNHNSSYRPPLQLATENRYFNEEVIRCLVKYGADPNLKVEKNGYFLLHLSIADGHFEGTKALIENGADLNIENQEEDFWLFSGKSPNAFKGDISLHFVIRAYRENQVITPEKTKQVLEILEYLIQKNANINAQNTHGQAPLHLAMFYEVPEVTELLIKSGADINIRDNSGRTPFDIEYERQKRVKMKKTAEEEVQALAKMKKTDEEGVAAKKFRRANVEADCLNAQVYENDMNNSSNSCANISTDTKISQENANTKEHYETSRKKLRATVGITSIVCTIAIAVAASTSPAIAVVAALISMVGLIIGCCVGKKYYQEMKQYKSQLSNSYVDCSSVSKSVTL